jgi:hypothetical protein
MPPDRSSNEAKEFLYRQRYTNELPIIPIDPKLVNFLPSDRHYKYSDNTLFQNYPLNIDTPDVENGFGCRPLQYGYLERAFRGDDEPTSDILHPEDKALLAKPRVSKSVFSRPIVPWLRRTEYISSDTKTFGRQVDDIEEKYIYFIQNQERKHPKDERRTG